MKRSVTFVLSLVMLYGCSAVAAQRHGKPATTGIDNAEAKQARDKDDSGKKMDKGKFKGKKHGHAKGHSK